MRIMIDQGGGPFYMCLRNTDQYNAHTQAGKTKLGKSLLIQYILMVEMPFL